MELMEKIVSLCKRRGFIYPGSEIYGGLANTYDYGPAGTELLRNIRNAWWDYFVHRRDDIVGLDASLISHHRVWEASGHVSGFADAMIDCKNCNARMRADALIENYIDALPSEVRETFIESHKTTADQNLKEVINALKSGKVEGLTTDALEGVMLLLSKVDPKRFPLICPNCSKSNWSKIRKFNLLFPVQLGIVEGEQGQGYLRGETAQLIFINFRNVVDSTRVKLPFGIAQLGKSFRNEITPGNSVFRTIEFEQAEIEYFFDPRKANWEKLFDDWKKNMWDFITQRLVIKASNLRWRTHTDEERSFYSKRTEDLEYKFPFGFKELWGLAYRTDYDLTQHMKFSKKDLSVIDPQTGEKLIPHVIEPAVGINRLLLMVLIDAYEEVEKRIILKINPKLAPFKVAVFPLVANNPDLVKKAREVYKLLKKDYMVAWDDRGNIGKRYLSQDEIGTPWCVTIDYDTLKYDTLTIRDRDTTKQIREKIVKLDDYFKERLK